MNVSQMLAHCQAPIELALGERTTKRGLLAILLGGWAKRKFLAEKPYDRSMPTDPSYVIKDNKDFEQERDRLAQKVRQMSQGARRC